WRCPCHNDPHLRLAEDDTGMAQGDTRAQATLVAESDPTVNLSSTQTRLSGRWLTIARAAWLAAALVYVTLFLAGVPIYLDYLSTVCPANPTCPFGPRPYPGVEAIQAAGLTATSLAAYFTALSVIGTVGYTLVAAFIFWKRSDERMALFVSFALL